MSFSKLITGQKIVPVVVIDNKAQALGLSEALLEGGVSVIEVTLRNDYGLTAIGDIAKAFPEMTIVAGTVTNKESMLAATAKGAAGIVSPGLTEPLLQAAVNNNITLLPGVTSPSEIIQAMEYGLTECKLFPASLVGGISMLKALSGPFPTISFCPTGGVSESNFEEYLSLANVMCVGGSWIASRRMIRGLKWQQITDKCLKTNKLLLAGNK